MKSRMIVAASLTESDVVVEGTTVEECYRISNPYYGLPIAIDVSSISNFDF